MCESDPFLQTEAMHKMPQTPMQGGSCVSAATTITLSSLNTGQRKLLLPCWAWLLCVTAKKRREKKPECRSDRISQDRILEAACISAYIIKNKSTGTGVSRIQCKIIHEGLWPIRFCDLIRIFLEFGLAGRGPAVFVSQNLMSQNLVEHRQTPNVPF